MLERVGQVILGLYVLKGRLSWFGFKYSALYLTTVWCNCNFGAFWRKISKIFGKVDRSAYFSTLFNLIERKNPGYISMPVLNSSFFNFNICYFLAIR